MTPQERYGLAWGEACPVCSQQPGEACAEWHGAVLVGLLELPHVERLAQANWRAAVERGEGDAGPHVASPELIRAVAGELV